MKIHWLTITAMVLIVLTLVCTLFLAGAATGVGLAAIATSILAYTEHTGT